ncbi:hypothetical protein E1B28_013607 [Marasmius oreades]|uniref:NADP-dependent oxidoreductase domain-containing protein n=1 Tax=Marasmius oreades TaxID=181124 RepID=A0A9P7RPV4_9AGAR|nr:uncharacterized protein E1B28_013607 [Marasmius oreades]KAG7087659.1 hypothetical protein E1B28_013607 [Marasmius oreades]
MPDNEMQYVRLGQSGLKISKIVFGCMSYGTPEWQKWVLDEEESMKHIMVAYDAGINAFDTANVYSNGRSEIVLGKAIKKYNLDRDRIVVMTKVYFAVGDTPDFVSLGKTSEALDQAGYANRRGLSRKHIFESVKHSLARLQLDYVDLLQCAYLRILLPRQAAYRFDMIGHRFDTETPIEETMQALHDVVQAGYVRYIGMSSCRAWQFHAMQNYAINNKLTPFISMQNHYNLVYREEEREMFPTLKYFNVGSIPWSPLARGLLTRPLSQQTKRGETDRMIKGYSPGEIVDRVEELAKKKGVTMAQIAFAWVANRPGVSAPIVGATSLDNLKELIAAINIKLSDEEVQYLEETYTSRTLMGL